MRALIVSFCSKSLGLLALFLCYMTGEIVVRVANLPLPGALLGLLLLLAALLLLKRTPLFITRGARPLLIHMSVLFVPAVCAIVVIWAQIAPYLMSISTAIILSTALSLGVTAWVAVRIFKPSARSCRNDD